MIKVSNIKAPIGSDAEQIRLLAAEKLGVKTDAISDFSLSRLSIDARRKGSVHYVCAANVSAENEKKLISRAKSPDVVFYEPLSYTFPEVKRSSSLRPIVVGMGPAGLFAALELARAGLCPIVLERGRNVDERTGDVEHFWKSGSLSVSSNVQFGEGGAGTFSDGKLTTGISDRRIAHVFSSFVEHGAPVDITYQAKPHIGTDILRDVVRGIREEIKALGGDVRFENTLYDIKITDNAVSAITVMTETGPYEEPCDTLIIALGHSARDSFEMLFNSGIKMEQKAFSIGVRIEHEQKMVSEAQYASFAKRLPPADYKLSCHLPSGRSAYSFCVCPGGQVIAASSEYGKLVTNGMSYRARDGKNINGGFLVGVQPSDFNDKHPLSGVRFQQLWEEKAFTLGGGNFYAPVQTVRDFLDKRASANIGRIEPTYRPGVNPTDLHGCLPNFVADTLAGALPIFNRTLNGFASPDALMTGVETRSSSPVRIVRGEDFQSSIRGIYPCGEGAGYAGGITSAAVDGIKVAEAVALKE